MPRIVPVIKNYEWGKPAHSSLVHRVAAASGGTSAEGRHWAEAWIGSHVSGPATFLSGAALTSDCGFLLKVLSIGRCLSLQIHPDADAARVLHAREPENFPDDQSKPELVVALTPMKIFCGFAPPDKIKHNFTQAYPRLAVKLGPSIQQLLTEEPDAARKVCTALVTADANTKAELLSALREDVEESTASALDGVVAQLFRDFPADEGILLCLCLNLVELPPFNSIAVEPCVPHAYISGDAVECMRASDNVIRFGLTPKHRDLATFIQLARFDSSDPTPHSPVPLRLARHFQLSEHPCPFSDVFTLVCCLNADSQDAETSVLVQEGREFMGVNLGDAVRVNGDLISSFECFYEQSPLTITAESPGDYCLFFAYKKDQPTLSS